MKKWLYLFTLIVLIGALALTACGGSNASTTSGSESPLVTVPAEYKDMKNPFVGQSEAADAGKVIYEQKCATCHGETGKGDGAGGAALNPRPGDLSKPTVDTDGYLYWRIAEGGLVDPFKSDGSAMPAWKTVLSQDEIWQAVTFIRTLK
jgi:mono/diheme cytochrome c family protein